MVKYISTIYLIVFSVFFTKGCSCQNSHMTINVIQPKDTPPEAQLFIAGNNQQLGDWNPALVNMIKSSDSLWTIT
jgi:hypothetical protein